MILNKVKGIKTSCQWLVLWGQAQCKENVQTEKQVEIKIKVGSARTSGKQLWAGFAGLGTDSCPGFSASNLFPVSYNASYRVSVCVGGGGGSVCVCVCTRALTSMRVSMSVCMCVYARSFALR